MSFTGLIFGLHSVGYAFINFEDVSGHIARTQLPGRWLVNSHTPSSTLVLVAIIWKLEGSRNYSLWMLERAIVGENDLSISLHDTITDIGSGIATIVTRSPRCPMPVRSLYKNASMWFVWHVAAIQGRDCLVQKFRNSSVMLELPSFRPKVSSPGCSRENILIKSSKIYHTGTSPIAGSEDKFPGPDNPSKMRRSVENAEHVGQLHKASSASSATWLLNRRAFRT